jgi:hypothetical protein
MSQAEQRLHLRLRGCHSFCDSAHSTSRYGVESICAVVPIAPSTYFRHKAEQRDPTRRSARTQHDAVLRAIILRIRTENHQVLTAPQKPPHVEKKNR